MSLTIVLKAIDGLILAADSRVTKGYTLEGPKTRDDSVKFIQLNDDWGVMTYGLSDIGYKGITSLKKEVIKDDSQPISSASLLEKAKQVFVSVNASWEKKNPEIKRRDSDVGFVIAGYERSDREYKVFNLQSPDFSFKQIENSCLIAGQWHIAKYFISRIYSKEMMVQTLIGIAFFLLSATMTVDKTVGGAIHIASITEADGFQWASDSEMKAAARKSKWISSLFREQFYSSLMSVVDNE